MRVARQAERVREHLSLRRPGVRVCGERRPVLSLPVSGAAAARPGAQLRGGRRARGAARRDRCHPGNGGDQAPDGDRRTPCRPFPDLRCAANEVPRVEAAEGYGMSSVRGEPYSNDAHRLRAVLRYSCHGPGAGSGGDREPRNRDRVESISSGGSTTATPRSSSMCASRTNIRSTGLPVRRSCRLGKCLGATRSSTPTRKWSCFASWAYEAAKAADFLRSVGFTKVLNLKGGILDWIDKVDPTQPRY